MNEDYLHDPNAICSICGKPGGSHAMAGNNCPSPDGADTLFEQTKFTPIPPPTTEQAKLWKEFLDEASGQLYAIDAETISENSAIELLHEKYSITRKQEVPEAVEFAEWMQSAGWERYDGPDRWINMSNGNKVLTTDQVYKEFQLFKQQKP